MNIGTIQTGLAPGDKDRLEEARESVAQAQALLVDWDGCLAFNNRPTAAALRFLKENSARMAIVSNNSTHRPIDFAEILEREGVRIAPDRILLAGSEALSRASELELDRVLLVGHRRMLDHARARGLNLCQRAARAVILMRDPTFNYAKLKRAANCVRGGAKLLVSNPDFTHPGRYGRVVPETGALLESLKACLGAEPIDLEVIGKPHPTLFNRACEALNATPARALMIGDNPATDAVGARNVGVACLMIGDGTGLTFDRLVSKGR